MMIVMKMQLKMNFTFAAFHFNFADKTRYLKVATTTTKLAGAVKCKLASNCFVCKNCGGAIIYIKMKKIHRLWADNVP